MNALRIWCDSCGRSWVVDAAFSVYVLLDIESRPCPHCEAYTLSCRDASEFRDRSGHSMKANLLATDETRIEHG